MDSYEVVMRTIKFEGPDRLPYNFGGIGETDFFGVGYVPGMTRISEEKSLDEWGCLWKSWGQGLIGEPIGHPIEDWSQFDSYKWPDPDDPQRYAHIEDRLKQAGDKFVLAGIDGILRRARFARGFPNLMVDLCLEPDKAMALIEGVLDFMLRVLENYSQFEGIHGISMPEDWGTQTQSFIRPAMFTELFPPIYKRLFDAVHSHGWIMRMHSDGKINDLIGDFIDCGLDVIELEQPRALGIEEIGRRYRGKICFEGSIDIQATLPTADRELIRREARELIQNWATPQGGFIGVCYHGSDLGISDETLKVALEAFREYGDVWKRQGGSL